MYYTKFASIFCPIIIVGDNDGITNLHLETGESKREFKIAPEWIENDLFFNDAQKQIDEYFKRERKAFDLKLNLKATEFQAKVWSVLSTIPYGKLCCYQDIAIMIDNKKAVRAVGMANNKNPVPLIIPCHRVVGKNGKLAGFAHGVSLKEKLISFEAGKSIITKLYPS